MRKCWLCLRIITPTPTEYWHPNCYASYTRKQSIRHATPGDRLKQTSQQDKDGVISTWTFRCLICKNKTYKKSRNLTLCIFEACQGVRSAAERKGDSFILNSVYGDLIVAEANYHRNVSVNDENTTSLVKHIVLQALSNNR